MHTHINAIAGLSIVATYVATVGVVNMLSRKYPDHPASQGWQLIASPN